jgi:hypothetical protein
MPTLTSHSHLSQVTEMCFISMSTLPSHLTVTFPNQIQKSETIILKSLLWL